MDFIGITTTSERFQHGPRWISFRPVRDLESTVLCSLLVILARSSDAFDIDDTLAIRCDIASVPADRGRVPLTHKTVLQRSILTNENTDDLYRVLWCVRKYILCEVRSGTLLYDWDRVRKKKRM